MWKRFIQLTDKTFTGKNFNRKNWKKLEKTILEKTIMVRWGRNFFLLNNYFFPETICPFVFQECDVLIANKNKLSGGQGTFVSV